MKNLIYLVSSHDKAPQGGGDAKSWLLYYKLSIGPEDETYVLGDYGMCYGVEKGDRLWFCLSEPDERRLVGCVIVDRIEHDSVNGRDEYWYKGESLVELDVLFTDDMFTTIRNGELWNDLSKRLPKPVSG
jgi:hypothetical protein